MKICTITCQNADNYGARLQAYALAKYLKLQGHEVEVIDYRPSYMDFGMHQWYKPKSVKDFVKLFLQFGLRKRTIKRHESFASFSSRHMPLTSIVYKDIRQLRDNPPDADAYIAGSDQIWNTTFPNGKDAAFYLDFGSREVKRISYAASFATQSLVKGTEAFVLDKLPHIDKVSVREKSGLSILHSFGLEGQVVVDPVLLLSKNHWDELLSGETFDEPYILVYDFFSSANVKCVSKRISKLLHCKIYSVSPCLLSYADRNFCLASPENFINLIKQARYVISNSFHGTLFAMIYHRDFIVVERNDGLNERMKDWLSRCGIEERIVDTRASDSRLVHEIDYEKLDKKIAKLVNDSKEFLRDSL